MYKEVNPHTQLMTPRVVPKENSPLGDTAKQGLILDASWGG